MQKLVPADGIRPYHPSLPDVAVRVGLRKRVIDHHRYVRRRE